MVKAASGKPLSVIYIEAILCCVGFMVFSFFIQHPFPLVLISVAALAVPAYIISRNIHSVKDIPEVLGLRFAHTTILYIIAGLLLGVLYAMVYRNNRQEDLFPELLTWFALPAALIGATEELVFRGFLQGYCKKASLVFAVLFATFAHTAYKCCLFMSPFNESEINLSFLIIWTFAGGLLFGILREMAKSIYPAVLAHLVFDVLVYGELIQPPWWVW